MVVSGFSEKLFKKLESSTERFEVRVMMMDVIARLIGVHQVLLYTADQIESRFFCTNYKLVFLVVPVQLLPFSSKISSTSPKRLVLTSCAFVLSYRHFCADNSVPFFINTLKHSGNKDFFVFCTINFYWHRFSIFTVCEHEYINSPPPHRSDYDWGSWLSTKKA